jgi:DnaJ-class molecular chaperone
MARIKDKVIDQMNKGICKECGDSMEWLEDEEECDMCYGMGSIDHDAGMVIVPCSFCGGTGIVEVKGWFCENCDR